MNFGDEATLCFDKLIIGGHSFGGMTALSVAEKDERIKAVFTFDPWVYARNDDIMNKNLVVTQPNFHVITSGFAPVVKKYFFYDTEESMKNLLAASTSNTKELAYLRGCNHYHQTDAICIVPIEVFIKSSNKPQINVCELYLLNT